MPAVLMQRRSRLQHLRPELSPQQPPKEQRGQGEQHHRHAEATREPISEALDWGLAGLGVFHQGHDPGHRTLTPRAQHLQHQGTLQIQGACREFLARLGLQRQGFSSEAGDIEKRASFQHLAINGHPIARQQANAITRPQGSHLHRLHPGLRPLPQQQQGLIGLQLRELLEGSSGAKTGAFLQKPPQQNKAEQGDRLVEKALPTNRGPQQGHKAGEVGTAHPQTHQGVHARSTGQGGTPSLNEDRSPRERQRQRGDHGMHTNIREQGQLEMSRGGQHQQHHRHHKGAPALPPAAVLQTLRQAPRQISLLSRTGLGAVSHSREGLDQPLGRLQRRDLGVKTHPGGASEQVHAGLPHPRLCQ